MLAELQTVKTCSCREHEGSSLVGFFAVDSIRSFPAVVGLDGEAVLTLALTIQWLLGPDQTLTGGAVQNHCFKLDRTRTQWAIMNPETTDFTCVGQERKKSIRNQYM